MNIEFINWDWEVLIMGLTLETDQRANKREWDGKFGKNVCRNTVEDFFSMSERR